MSQVVYKSKHGDEYFVVVRSSELLEAWKAGDSDTIQLSEVLDGDNIYYGKSSTPSTQKLATDFDTSVQDDVIKFILKNGKLKGGSVTSNKGTTVRNPAHTGIDTRGPGVSTTGV